jgi:hypothetical protein
MESEIEAAEEGRMICSADLGPNNPVFVQAGAAEAG